MNKGKILMSLLLVFFLAGISSCNNDDPKPSKTELISRTWKLSGAKIAGQDVFEYYDGCELDNLYIFTKDGNYTMDEGAAKCDQADPQTKTGKWSFPENNVIEIVYSNGPTELQHIVTLSKTTLKVTLTFPGNNVVYELTFTAQ